MKLFVCVFLILLLVEEFHCKPCLAELLGLTRGRKRQLSLGAQFKVNAGISGEDSDTHVEKVPRRPYQESPPIRFPPPFYFAPPPYGPYRGIGGPNEDTSQQPKFAAVYYPPYGWMFVPSDALQRAPANRAKTSNTRSNQ